MAYSAELWKEAKKKCRLNENDIKMAKELGLNPKSLMKNIPGKNQQWKAPVKEWIREMHEDRFGSTKKRKSGGSIRRPKNEMNNIPREDGRNAEDVDFDSPF